MEAAALVYARAKAVIGIYGMGLTQHVKGVATVQMLANLLLLRGNIGRPGAGICPVRGHSNVQGQRTVGITEKPDLVPLDRSGGAIRFCAATRRGAEHRRRLRGDAGATRSTAFIGLGGNFIRAVPDREPMEAAWRRLPLTVQISTKLNRSHVVHGEAAYILPCLGRTELDRAGERSAGGVVGGQHRLHPWFARQARAGQSDI